MLPHDFTHRTHFPGTVTSRFGWVVRPADWIASLPAPLFAVLLFLLALVPAQLDVRQAVLVWLFFAGDWLLLALLPRARKSFGPAKPPTLLLAMMRLIPALLPLPWNLVMQALGTALVVYAFWVEPHRIRVTRRSLRSPKLKSGERLRLLHFGDLHIERVTGREEQLVELARSLAPDVILFSGDFLSLSSVHDPVGWEHARRILGQLSAPLGVYAVTGSPPVDEPEIVGKLLDGLPIRWLQDEQVSLSFHGDTLNLVGITCSHKPFADAATLDSVLRRKTCHFTILLYHSPDLAPEAALRGVDLQLSGHTHGGQVCLPLVGALYTASLYGKRFESGQRQLNGLTLYVTRGIGMEGKGAPRARFLCPPEIVLWELAGS